MKTLIENFYKKSCDDVNALWYGTGHFFVQTKDGKITQIPRHNTDKHLQGISDEQIKQAHEVGYFILSNAPQSSGHYSIEYMVKLLRGGGAISTDGYAKAKAEYDAIKKAPIHEKESRRRDQMPTIILGEKGTGQINVLPPPPPEAVYSLIHQAYITPDSSSKHVKSDSK